MAGEVQGPVPAGAASTEPPAAAEAEEPPSPGGARNMDVPGLMGVGSPVSPAQRAPAAAMIEYASPPSNVSEFVDAFHEGEEVRFRRIDNVIGEAETLVGSWARQRRSAPHECRRANHVCRCGARRGVAQGDARRDGGHRAEWDLGLGRSAGKLSADRAQVGLQSEAGRARRSGEAQGATRGPWIRATRGD